jgi:hypothetical protein
MSALPECPECRGPSVPECWHPDASEGEALGRVAVSRRASQYGEKLRCLACDHRHKAKSLEAAFDALDETDRLLRDSDGRFFYGETLARMGAKWRERIAEDKAKFARAMEGRW